MHWYLAIFLPVIVTPSSPKKCTISLFLKKAQRCKQMCFLLLVVAFRSTSHVTMFWFRVVRPSKNSTENSENLEWTWLSFFWGTPILFVFFPDVSWTRGPGSMVLTETKPSKCVTWGQALDALQVIHYQSSFAWKKLIFDMWRCQRNC